jgi:hypothetical protein
MSVTFIIQHGKGMRRIFLSYVVCRAIQYFSTLFHKRGDLKKIVFETNICVMIFCIMFETFIILRRTQRDITINVNRSSCTVYIISVRL